MTNFLLKVIAFALLLSFGTSSSAEEVWDAKVAEFVGLHPGRMDGKVCFITGATSGLGEHNAYHLAKEGCAIVATGRRTVKGAAVVEHINSVTTSTLDPPAMFIQVDVTKPETIKAAVATIEETYGRLDGVVANAGVGGLNPVDGSEKTESDFDRIINVNVNGVFRTVNAAVPLMKSAGNGGSIILTSSIYGLEANGYMPAYITSKHALEGMKKALAGELNVYGIRVNNVNPSFTPSEMTEAVNFPEFESYNQNVVRMFQADGLMATMGEISSSVAWLLSEDSTYVSGLSIHVDGGSVGQTIPVMLMHKTMGEVGAALAASSAAAAAEEAAKEEVY